MAKFKNMKFCVKSEEHSKQLQEKLFGKGYGWRVSANAMRNYIMYTDLLFLYTDDNGCIKLGNNEEGFLENESPEYTLEELIEETTSELQPSTGENLTENHLSQQDYTKSYYDFFYTLTEKDIEAGKIKLDPYFVSKQWKIGSKDDSGILFHSLKTIARFGDKNTREREIKALYNQIISLANLEGVDLP